MIKNRIASNLIVLRKKTRLSQERFVQELEKKGCYIQRSAYGAYEENRNQPNIETIKAIADHYDISMDELCFGNITEN